MMKNSILAHRGWWLDQSEKNSEVAFERALAAGFGVETDFRDLDGRLVISHDPPTRNPTLRDADWFFSLVKAQRSEGRLALNVKADGLQDALASSLLKAGLPDSQVFAFDMAVPDALGYLARNFPLYARLSEHEDTPIFSDRIAGVWVDNFDGGFSQVSRAADVMASGIRAAIVSSELHRRDPEPLWKEILEAGLHKNPLFELCTDFPQRAVETFGS